MTMIRKPNLYWLLALVILFAVVLPALLFAVKLPPMNTHALERHDGGAVTAYNIVQKNGNDNNRHDCEDGRTRWICEMGEGRNGSELYAIVVVAGTFLVTCFICRKQYAESIIENNGSV